MIGAIAAWGGKKAAKSLIKAAKGKQKKKTPTYLNLNGGGGATGSWAAPTLPRMPEGADIDIVASTEYELDPVTGEIKPKCKRRRRRRLLTASDKSDIAFLRGTLGGGELGRAAISAVLSRRVS